MTQTVRTIRIATQGPAGPAGLYPKPYWDSSHCPYPCNSVLTHNGSVWLALRSTSAEPSDSVTDDWASWLNADGFVTLGDDGKIPTSQLPASILGALNYQGTWNAATNSPAIAAAASGNKGWYYKVSVAGTTAISGISDWGVGDWLVSNGASWDKIDNTDQVLSVADRTGAVSLNAGDIAGLAASATTDATNAANITSGTLSNSRLSGVALTANNLSDLGNAATARTNLGLGTLATLGAGSGLTSGGGNLSANVTSVAGRTGAVALTSSDIAHGIVIAASSVTPVSHTGDTSETVLATISVPAMPAGAFLRLTMWFTATSSANNKTYKMYFGASGSGAGGTAYMNVGPVTTNAVVATQRLLLNRTTSSQIAAHLLTNVNAFSAATAATTSSVSTTVATEMTITGILANSGDSMTLEGYLLELILP